jgi:hypothetical protein
MKKQIIAVAAAGAAVLTLGTAGGAVAGSLVTSHDIKDNTVRSIDLKDAGVKRVDLSKSINRSLAKVGQDGIAGPAGTDGKDGLNGTDGQDGTNGTDGTDVDAAVLQDLRDRIDALEGNAATGHDLNTNWEKGEGATIKDANTVLLDSREQGYAYASIKNLDLLIDQSAVIEYTYRLDNGAHVGWGAPRLKIVVGGVAYSSVNQVNPDYGHDNGDGTFTVTAIATTLNDNNQTQVPAGTITRASLIYDYQDRGTVEFTNVVIDGQPISFK